MRIYITLCFSIIFLINNSFSQVNFLRDTSIEVYQNNNRLKNAWNGGINSAQFSNIDLNLATYKLGLGDYTLYFRSQVKGKYKRVSDTELKIAKFEEKNPCVCFCKKSFTNYRKKVHHECFC